MLINRRCHVNHAKLVQTKLELNLAVVLLPQWEYRHDDTNTRSTNSLASLHVHLHVPSLLSPYQARNGSDASKDPTASRMLRACACYSTVDAGCPFSSSYPAFPFCPLHYVFSSQSLSSIGQVRRAVSQRSMQCRWNACMHLPHTIVQESVCDLPCWQSRHSSTFRLRQIAQSSTSRSQDQMAR